MILFQMLAGDVPFKGSSIPAIMKKHVSDLPPKFAELGVKVNPQIERAVRHSLSKDRKDRPQSVKQFISELTQAVNSTSSLDAARIPGMLQQEQPDVTASLQILTIPPQSQVFVDNVAVGNSRPDGWLMLEGLQSGKHHIRVRHDGFVDFESEFDSDGNPKEVVAQLTRDTGAIPKPMRYDDAGNRTINAEYASEFVEYARDANNASSDRAAALFANRTAKHPNADAGAEISFFIACCFGINWSFRLATFVRNRIWRCMDGGTFRAPTTSG